MKLSDILLDPALGENSFKIGLQSVLYHDLEKVEKLYNVAFKSCANSASKKMLLRTNQWCLKRLRFPL